MPDWDAQPSAIRWLRWPLRTFRHALEGWALWADAVALLLFLVPRVQSIAAAFGYAAPSWIVNALTGVFSQMSQPIASLLAALILLQAVARAGMDEERQRPRLSPEHVRDLQEQAAQFHKVLAMPRHYFQLGRGSVLAGYYCEHFPNVAVTIRQWDDDARRWNKALAVLHDRVERDSTRSIEGVTVSISGVLNAVAMGSYSSPMEVVWGVQEAGVGLDHYVSNLFFQDALTNQPITLCTIPQGVDPLLFAKGIQQWLDEARNWPESIEYREIVHRLEQVRLTLSHQLEATQLDHSPGGRCDGCRPVSSR